MDRLYSVVRCRRPLIGVRGVQWERAARREEVEEREVQTNHALISSFHSAEATEGETQVPVHTNTSIETGVKTEILCLQFIWGIVGKALLASIVIKQTLLY